MLYKPIATNGLFDSYVVEYLLAQSISPAPFTGVELVNWQMKYTNRVVAKMCMWPICNNQTSNPQCCVYAVTQAIIAVIMNATHLWSQ